MNVASFSWREKVLRRVKDTLLQDGGFHFQRTTSSPCFSLAPAYAPDRLSTTMTKVTTKRTAWAPSSTALNRSTPAIAEADDDGSTMRPATMVGGWSEQTILRPLPRRR